LIGQEQARAAAQLGADFIGAVRTGEVDWLASVVAPGSAAALQLEIFGVALFRIGLRLDDPEEQGKLAPYDFQFEGEVGLLELGVIEPLPEGQGHLRRLFGSSLLLQATGNGWQISELIPVNSDGNLHPNSPADHEVLAVYQGHKALPLQTANLDLVERLFLAKMQMQTGWFNLEELLNAVRLWRDYRAKQTVSKRQVASLAAAVEYLISLFDYFQVDSQEVAQRYATTTPALLNRSREIAQTLNATQFNDRYSIHPDPIAHYRQLFRDIGGAFDQEEIERARREYTKVFDTVEVPPDDLDFFGPN